MPRSSNHPGSFFQQDELPLFGEPTEGVEDRDLRVFLGWDQPLVAAVVEFLAGTWSGGGPLDLADTLVVVPTKNAGRRLREALALHAAEREEAVLPPLVTTPDFLIAPERVDLETGARVGKSLAFLTWAAQLHRMDLEAYRDLFPVAPVERGVKWAADQAAELLRVRHLLMEGGLSIADAARRMEQEGMEPARWEDFARLEAEVLESYGQLGLEDDLQTRLRVGECGVLPDGIGRLLVAGVPDLSALVCRAVQRYSALADVRILVGAPPTLAAEFDEWGRPVPARWAAREIGIDAPQTRIHQAGDPEEQAEIVWKLVEAAGHAEEKDPGATMAVGVPDAELIPYVAGALERKGYRSHDPGGTPLSRESILYLLRQLHAVLATRSYRAWSRLMRCQGVAEAALPAEAGPGRAARLFVGMDRFAEHCLPRWLAGAVELADRHMAEFHPEVAEALRWWSGWERRLEKEDFTETLTGFLALVYADMKVSGSDPRAAVLSEVASSIFRLDEDFSKVASRFGGPLDVRERLEILLALMPDERIYLPREGGEVDLGGWLEQLWEDAPHLIVTGMNDGVVPEDIIGHAFLPDSARRKLGITNNDDRFARDAYLLTAMARSHGGPGRRLDLIFGRFNAHKDPLRPSRLLLQCRDEELAERTLQLFQEAAAPGEVIARAVPWRLVPWRLEEDHRLFQRVSVSALRHYLQCPFRFYLVQGLGMKPVDAGKAELGADDFGNLVHHALEQLAVVEGAGDLDQAGDLEDFFRARVDAYLLDRYGKGWPVSVRLQREAALVRLRWWSEVEAASRRSGWRIVEGEVPFGDEGWPLVIQGTPVRGRVDRVERHPDRGIRILDFKTGSVPTERKGGRSPSEQAHLVPLKRHEDPGQFPDWLLVEDGQGKSWRWADLQLPLYVLAASSRFSGESVVAGYALLGKEEGSVFIDTWDTLDDALLQAAERCASGILEAIREQRFWPPSPSPGEWDEFRHLLFPSPDEAVDASAFECLPE